MQTEKRCGLCPRECKVDRTQGERGYCGQTAELYVARAALHQWEEPCLSGTIGSGTIFFTGCPLGCVFCQNLEIAAGNVGKKISVKRLAEIFLELQEQGAHNINLVTATHFVPQIAEALSLAKQNGLQIPIVYNTSSYEHVSTLRLLEGLVDIYLPDLKYRNEEWSLRYSHAADYFFYASKAIAEMVRQVGKPVFSEEDGLMKRGVIVRHLALPGKEEDSKEVIRYLYETYGEQIYISIMNQFTPMPGLREYPELNRVLTEQEYSRIVDYAIRLGVEQGYIQEGETAKESFIPSFDCEGV
ncbi:MAG: radical SAM protein [Lachnospiraceae bacterium]|nr:radical SAM protein [Lachnospiraceae bacterium]